MLSSAIEASKILAFGDVRAGVLIAGRIGTGAGAVRIRGSVTRRKTARRNTYINHINVTPRPRPLSTSRLSRASLSSSPPAATPSTPLTPGA